jgi:hypothetical protein
MLDALDRRILHAVRQLQLESPTARSFAAVDIVLRVKLPLDQVAGRLAALATGHYLARDRSFNGPPRYRLTDFGELLDSLVTTGLDELDPLSQTSPRGP